MGVLVGVGTIWDTDLPLLLIQNRVKTVDHSNEGGLRSVWDVAEDCILDVVLHCVHHLRGSNGVVRDMQDRDGDRGR